MENKQQQPYPLRMPDELKEWVRVSAFNNRWSINAELNALIEMAKEAMEKKDRLEKPI